MTKSTSQNFYNFKKVSTEEWQSLIGQDQKDAPLDSLNSQPEKGINLIPFYHFDQTEKTSDSFQNLKKQGISGHSNDWKLCQKLKPDDLQQNEIKSLLNSFILNDVGIIEFEFEEIIDFESIAILCSDSFHAIILKSHALDKIMDFVIALKPYHKGKIYVDYFISEQLLSGKLVDRSILTRLKKLSLESGMKVQIALSADSIVENGAQSIDEGIYLLSQFTQLYTECIEIDFQTGFLIRLNSGSNYFINLAKIRAIRKLTQFISDAFKDLCDLEIEAHSGIWNKSVYDRYTNILRLTSESFASVSAGVDILTISDFEEALDISNQFSLRNARNISHLLKHESHLDKVLDPAAGSYYVENLTHDYAEKVWNGFKEIEKQGGLEQHLKSKDLKAAISSEGSSIREKFGKTSVKMIGTNVFPNSNDHLTLENISERITNRLSFEFEKIRCAVDKYAIEHGEKKRPEAALLRLGTSEMRFARAGFSTNFLECAGIRMKEFDGMPATLPDSRILVICASDQDYLTSGKDWVANLNKSKTSNQLLILAGYPENSDELKSHGINFFIHLRAPLEDTLLKILKALDIE